MIFLRRQLPLAICFVTGVVFALQYYVPHEYSELTLTHVNDWLLVIGGFAAVLGLASLINFHWVRVKKREAGWGYSLLVFLSMSLTIGVGMLSMGKVYEDGRQTALGWIYDDMLVPLQGTMFSLLAFFIASAAFRAFRARTSDAALLLVAAVVVMFGRVPLGEYLWDGLPDWKLALHETTLLLPPPIGRIVDWVLQVPNMAARRGVMIGVTLGAIATSLKIIFGIERGYLGGERE